MTCLSTAEKVICKNIELEHLIWHFIEWFDGFQAQNQPWCMKGR